MFSCFFERFRVRSSKIANFGPSPEKVENGFQELQNSEFRARAPKRQKIGFRSSKIANFGPDLEKAENVPQELENSEFRARAPKRRK